MTGEPTWCEVDPCAIGEVDALNARKRNVEGRLVRAIENRQLSHRRAA
jgi:hypothetical protein